MGLWYHQKWAFAIKLGSIRSVTRLHLKEIRPFESIRSAESRNSTARGAQPEGRWNFARAKNYHKKRLSQVQNKVILAVNFLNKVHISDFG